MGCGQSSVPSNSQGRPGIVREGTNSTINTHTVIPEIKIHTVVTDELDFDHESSMRIPLGEVTDEQLLAEVARRKLDLHDSITDALVKETYDIGRVLGHGASGEVTLATHKVTKLQYACKIVRKDSNMNDAQSMSTEIEIMKRIRHRHVVSMYELYETPKCLWIILELVEGGDLLHYLAVQDHYNEKQAARHFKQILQGIHYLHTLGVVHRDLKLDNILLSNMKPEAEIKIADFGLSALVRLGEGGYDPDESNKRKRYCGLHETWGTREYFAPELIDQAYGPQADVWALGCVLYEMLCGYQAFAPHAHDTEEIFFERIRSGNYSFDHAAFKDNKISPEGIDLLQKLLVVDPVKRLSATEALYHPWISEKRKAHVTKRDVHGEELLEDAHNHLKFRYDERIRRNKQKAKK